MGLAIRERATAAVVGSKDVFHSIDLLRGLAALAVLIFHFKNFAGGGGDLSRKPEVFDRIQLLHWLHPIKENGALAVMLFWAISGFVFMNVYAGTRPGARHFWVNRIARLYPLHLLTLLVIAAIQFAAMRRLGHWFIFPANDLIHFIPHLFFASAWDPSSPHSFNGPVWSVSVEVLIYAAFYLYARTVRSSVASVVAGLVIFAVLMKLLPSWQAPLCGCFFFGGMLSYAVFRLWPEDRRLLLLGLALAALILLGALSVLAGARIPLTFRLLPVAMCLLVVAATSEVVAMRPMYRRTEFVGDITYSTYMWHSPIQMLFLFGAGLGFWRVDAAFTDGFFVAYLALVCVLAWLSFRFIERPAQRWVRARGLGRKQDKPLIGAP